MTRTSNGRSVASRIIGIAILVGIMSMVVPATGPAGGLRGTRLEYNVSGSDDALGITIEVVTAPKAPCSGEVHFGGQPMTLPPITTGPGGAGQWSWQVARGVPAGTWRVHVECSHPDLQQATLTFKASGTPHSRGHAALHTGPIHRGPVPGKALGGNGGGGANLYPVGQCTWYVATQRPDLPHFPGRSGNARNWITSAKKHHIPVGDTPVPGAVAVFQPGQYGAGKYGHVAYVVSVEASAKQMTVAEYNLLHPLAKDIKQMSWSGVKFIYGGPAGIGPAGGRPVATPLAHRGVPKISGKAEVDAELSCSPGLWEGSPPIEYSYRWLRSGIPIGGAEYMSYTTHEADGGYKLTCEVSARNGASTSSAVSEPLEIAGPPVNTAAPTLTGTPTPEHSLTCLVGSWEGPEPQQYTYAWWNGAVLAPGAQLSTYYVTQENVGEALHCEVKAKNNYGSRTAPSNILIISAE